MDVIYDRDNGQYVPVKFWANIDSLEDDAVEQALNVSRLPFAFKHVSVMPDAHVGYGVPIGTVFASDGYVLPNVVGVDIGCGMCYVPTNIEASQLYRGSKVIGKWPLGREICETILTRVPVGFKKHSEKRESLKLSDCFDRYITDGVEQPEELLQEYRDSYYSLGTLGGGNHFIELQRDTNTGKMAVMLHSGSRHFGYSVANYYNEYAKELNNIWYSERPNDELNYLPIDHKIGRSYIAWMNLALEFAHLNRASMMQVVKDILRLTVPEIEFRNQTNAHHNYAAMENHFGKNVMVHRKGAIRAREDDIGIIPGAMGATSYIVEGLGDFESFCSASHGAGRVMGRKEAKRKFTKAQVREALADRDVILVTPSNDVRDEFFAAYKDIDEVILQEAALVKPITKLETVCVIKG